MFCLKLKFKKKSILKVKILFNRKAKFLCSVLCEINLNNYLGFT